MYNRLFNKKMTIADAEAIYKEINDLERQSNITNTTQFSNTDKKLRNKIHRECKPCIAVAKNIFVTHVEFITHEKKQHDAIFYIDEAIQVECVSAMNDQEWGLKKEHMALYTRAPAMNAIKSEGLKNNRTIEETLPIALNNTMTLEFLEKESYPRILESFRQKCKSQKTKNIYKNTILIILYEDYPDIISPELTVPFLRQISASLQNEPHDFNGVYLVGTSGRVTTISDLKNSLS